MIELDNKNLQLKQFIVKDFFPEPQREEKWKNPAGEKIHLKY